MKFPEKLTPLLFLLLLVAAFLTGRYRAQIEYLKGGAAPVAPSGGEGAKTLGQQAQGGTEGQVAVPTLAPASLIAEEDWKTLLQKPAAVRGEEGARVTIVEFTDYQCPYCARHFSETQPQLEEQYIKTGKARYLVRDFPLPFHPNALPAAEAARCAGDQGKYWEMHDLLFKNQVEWSSSTDAKGQFVSYAGTVSGLEKGVFSSCLQSGKYTETVKADVAMAQRLGATGTPSFFVNRQLVVGAVPFTNFQQILEAAL